MYFGRHLRILSALLISSWFLLGCSISEQLQGYLGSEDQRPIVNVIFAPIAEGSSGSVVVSLSKALTEEVVIAYATADAQATTATDYTSLSDSLTFAAGETSKTISIATTNDLIYEADEIFNLAFVVPSTVSMAVTTKAITISEDDAKPTVQFSGPVATVAEDVLGGNYPVNVTLSGLCQYDVVVAYGVVAGGTATGFGSDYTLTAGTLTVPGGSLTGNFNISINNDTVYEGSENVFLRLTSPNTYADLGADDDLDLSITDNETMPTVQFAAGTSSASEATTPHTVNVTLSGQAQAVTSVQYAVTGGTATGSGTDYTLANGVLTFAALDISEDISIAIVNDIAADPGETIEITLSTPTGVSLGTTTLHTHTITDDDAPAPDAITVSSLTTSGVTSDDFTAQINFTGDNDSDATVTLYWCNATAQPGCDPETANAPLQGSVAMTRNSPAAGNYAATISNLAYPNYAGDTLNLRVVAVDADGVTGSPLNATMQLLPVLDIEEQAVLEGQSLNIVATLNKAYSSDVTFNYSSGGGDATPGGGLADYTGISGVATIAAGNTSVTLPAITTNDDGTSETTETFNVTMSAVVNATIVNAIALGRIVDNDPGISTPAGVNAPVPYMFPQSGNRTLLYGYHTAWDDSLNRYSIQLDNSGQSDSSFNIGTGFDGPIYAFKVLPNGKILAGGYFKKYNGESNRCLIKLNSDGTKDTTFNIGTGCDLSTSDVKGFVFQNDQKLIVWGQFSTFAGFSQLNLTRLNGDGSRDTTFDIGTGFSSSIADVKLQNNGKIIVGGSFTSVDGISSNRIVRLHADGSVDTDFSIGTGFNNSVTNLIVQPDNKIIVVGSFTSFNGFSQSYIMRLNQDGTRDMSFSLGTGFDGAVNGVMLLSDGKLLVHGSFLNFNGSSAARFIKLNSDGSRDSTFITGTAFNNSIYDWVVQDDGKVVIAGGFTQYNGFAQGYITRLNSDGTRDTAFNSGSGFNSSVSRILVSKTTGQIIASGWFSSYNGTSRDGLARLNTDGSVDTLFNGTGQFYNTGWGNFVTLKFFERSNGRIIGVGEFTSESPSLPRRTVMLGSNDLPDPSFVVPTQVGIGNTVVTQPDGKFLVGGWMSGVTGSSSMSIYRLNADGSVDTGFNASGAGLFGGTGPKKILLRTSGKMVVIGNFINYNGTAVNNIVQINANGSRDATFNVGSGLNSHSYDIVEQADSKVIIGGYFTTYRGTTRNRIARINTDGTYDTTFNIGTGFDNAVTQILLRPNGKILARGEFTQYQSVSRVGLAQINSDGSLDTNFDVGAGLDSYTRGMALQSDQKLLIWGNFTNYRGTGANSVVRINTDGTLDTTFNIGSGANGVVYDAQILQDGSIILVGEFTTFNGVARARAVRLFSDGTVDSQFNNGVGYNDYIYYTKVHENGDILVSGTFDYFNGSPKVYFNRMGVPTPISIGNLAISGVSENAFTVSVGFYGDSDSDAVATLWYCNSTDSPGCDPTTGTSIVMSRTGTGNGTFTANVTGLLAPNDPSDSFNLRVVVTDPDGVTGSPLNGTVELLPLLLITDSTAPEGTGIGPYVALSGTAYNSGDVVFNWATSDGTAIDGAADPDDDYTSASGVATIPAGTQFIFLPVISTKNDSSVEGNEYFTVTLSGLQNAVAGDISNAVTLQDDDITQTISVSDIASVTEGTNAQFVVTLSAVHTLPVVFNYATGDAGDTATAGVDYTSASGAATIAAGQMSVTLPGVMVATDAADAGEIFTMKLSSVTNVAGSGNDFIATATTQESAINDITVSTLSVSGVTSDDFTAQINFTGDGNANAVVMLYWCNETASPGCNPILDPLGTVAMTRNSPAAGNYAATISNVAYPNFAGDTLNIRVVATDADGVTGSPLNTTVQLLPVLDAEEQARMEGQSFNMVVKINKAYSSNVTFSYVTANDTATGADFTSASGVATIIAGQTSVTLAAINTNDDAAPESTEKFGLTISAPTNATIRTAQVFNKIVDNDLDQVWEQGFDGQISALAIQPDGKKVVGGYFTSYDFTLNFGQVAINSDGTENPIFRPNMLGSSIYAAAKAPDGKIYVGGWGAETARLYADGTIDSSFNIGVGTTDGYGIEAMTVQPDGKVLLSGYYTNFNGQGGRCLTRLNTDGSFDSTFNIGAGFNTGDHQYAFKMLVRPNGKIVLGGWFSGFNGSTHRRLLQLNQDGSVDTSFVTGSGFGPTCNWCSGIDDMVLQPDGKLVVVGYLETYKSTSIKTIARINTDGSLDTTANIGTATTNSLFAIVQQPDGKLLVGGNFTTYSGYARKSIVRLNSDLSIDTSFDTSNGPVGSVTDILLRPDGKVWISGSFSSVQGITRNRMALLNSDGTLDTSFDPGGSITGGGNAKLDSMFVLPDNGVLALGAFYAYRGDTSYNKIARLNLDGTLDTTFTSSGTGFNSGVLALAVQTDGKVLAGGPFTSYNGLGRNYLARTNSDGTLDTSFVQTGTGLNALVYSLGLQVDGKILVGGAFTSYDVESRSRLLRLNTDGTLDTSFAQIGAGLNGQVFDLKTQSDNKILVGGAFTSYDGVGRNYVARIHTDGTLDTSFTQTGSGLDSHVRTIGLQDDGKILVGGTFANYNGISRPSLARLNSDGTLDGTFTQTGTGFNSYVNTLTLQRDGKILVGGGFASYNSVNQPYLARLGTDGSLDTTFVQAGTGLNYFVNELLVHNDGKVLVAGQFTSYNGTKSLYYKEFAAPNNISIGNLRTSNITTSSFDVAVGFYGDANDDATATLWYCDNTTNPGCDPVSGPGQTSAAMSTTSGVFNGDATVSVTGLTSGRNYKFRVIFSDADGVSGSPIDSNVTLP